MARPRPVTFDKKKIVAENRRARFDYFIEDVFEAGIALQGKSYGLWHHCHLTKYFLLDRHKCRVHF